MHRMKNIKHGELKPQRDSRSGAGALWLQAAGNIVVGKAHKPEPRRPALPALKVGCTSAVDQDTAGQMIGAAAVFRLVQRLRSHLKTIRETGEEMHTAQRHQQEWPIVLEAKAICGGSRIAFTRVA